MLVSCHILHDVSAGGRPRPPEKLEHEGISLVDLSTFSTKSYIQNWTNMTIRYKIIWYATFAITMGYFEASIVEYLRELYYPEGFMFPLADVPRHILRIELGREAASIIMIWSISMFAGKWFINKFAAFCFCFGIWDIFYYLFLRLFEGWPLSLGTDDILFLIPLPWVGPVWAPIAVSIALIWAAVTIWELCSRGIKLTPTNFDWSMEIISGLIIISSFLYGAKAAILKDQLPRFPWLIWLTGMIIGIFIFIRSVHRAEDFESRKK